jgi:outer membrane protein assembly factor BamB
MKKFAMMMLCASGFYATCAQDDMSEIYKKEIDHPFSYTANGNDDGYSYVSNGKEITVIKNQTGEILWNKKFKEISDELGKVDDIIPMWDANVIFVFDRKIGKDKIACIDALKGELLWVSSKYQNVDDKENVIYISELDAFAITSKDHLTMIKVKSGEELWQTDKFKGIVATYNVMKDGSIVMINMKSSVIGSIFSGMKNQLVRINSKTGDIIWDQTYRGLVEKKVITRERLVTLTIDDDKVFLYMNGIQVFDLATGKPQWSAVYDESPSEVVKNKKPAGAKGFGAYGVVAQPVVVGDYIYVLDLVNRRNQFLKKYALKTGKLIWTSAEIKDARAIPGLYVVGDKVVLQVGGQVELQYWMIVKGTSTITGTAATERVEVVEFENVKPYNVQCFNAITGEQLWESEKMKKGLTNIFPSGNNIMVCSGKALYSMDLNTGKENYEKPLKEDNIGEADLIIDYHDQVIIIGEKGVSSRKKDDGSLTASSKFKRSTPLSHNNQIIYGDRSLALYTKNSDYAVYDLTTMKYKRFDARKGAEAFLADDGMALYVFESGSMIRKSKMTKLSTK